MKAGTSNTRVPDDVPASGVVAHEDPVLCLVIKRGLFRILHRNGDCREPSVGFDTHPRCNMELPTRRLLPTQPNWSNTAQGE